MYSAAGVGRRAVPDAVSRRTHSDAPVDRSLDQRVIEPTQDIGSESAAEFRGRSLRIALEARLTTLSDNVGLSRRLSALITTTFGSPSGP